MITNLTYLKDSFFALAPYLPNTYNKYALQGIEIDIILTEKGSGIENPLRVGD